MTGGHDGDEVDAGEALVPVPFLVGCRRSGLTLVRAMCESHPAIAIAPESRFLLTAVPDRGRPFETARFVETLYADEQFRRWGLSRTTVELAFHADQPKTYGGAVRRVYALWATERGKARYGDKTPDHVLGLGVLSALFPEARIVHVVRDGRDVAASFLELGWTDTIERAALHWRQRVLRGRQARDLLPAGSYHELRYEDLVDQTEATLRALCEAIDLPFDPAMLDHRRAAVAVARTEPRPHHNRYLGRAVMPRLRDWRRDLPATAVDRFEVVAGDVLAELGYELRTTKRPLGTRLAARRQWLAWHRQRLTRQGRRRLDSGPT